MRKFFIRYPIINTTIFLLILNNLSAQEYNLHVYTPQNTNWGLPSRIVRVIAFDDDNNKYFATESFVSFGTTYLAKVVRFDDLNWTTIWDPKDTIPPGPYSYIWDIVVENKNKIWIATEGGLVLSENGINRIYTKENSELPTNILSCLAWDRQQNLWIGTWNAGIVKYDKNTFFKFNASNSNLSSNTILCVSIDNLNDKWFGTRNSLVKISTTGEISNYSSNEIGYNVENITSIDFDTNNYVWFVTAYHLSKFDHIQFYDEPLTKYSPNGSMKIDSQDNIWLGCSWGLALFDGENWTEVILDFLDFIIFGKLG